jgi:hypothetical protein
MNLQAEVVFRFSSESVGTAGADIRRLADAAAEVGFEIAGARVEQAPPSRRSPGTGTSYVPLDPAAGKPEG